MQDSPASHARTDPEGAGASRPAPRRAPALAAIPHVVHGFFGRRGGVSRGIYASLNCGAGSHDDAAAVAENRRRAAAVLGVEPGALLTAHQVHSPDALVVEAPFPVEDRPRVDALVTARPGLAVAALAADCVPVLFADRQAPVVAAAHAGWRGALAGVLESAVATMVKEGARRERVVAAVGPAISGAAYEVGPEFVERFLAVEPDVADLFAPAERDGHAMFDLPAYAMRRLERAGLAAVERVPGCTYRDEADFFSYRRATRRGEPDYGRNVSAIAVRPVG